MMNDAAGAPDPLARLLRGDWSDPDGGGPIGVPVRAVAIERSLRGVEADLVAPLGLGRRYAVVSDPATHEVMGARVERALAGLGAVMPISLGDNPHADDATAEKLRQATTGADALIAVGSGTINDLCKYAAARDGKPYVVFATAPSMNGYTSGNAAITVGGHKKTLPATSPQGVFMDLEVLARAPQRMIRAGLGDSLCRPTAQADWLLSRWVRGSKYRRAPFALLAGDEAMLFDRPEALLHGDLVAMNALSRTLVLSGFGMTICGGSYPASQGEHLISHYIDMFAPAGRGAYFHGEQVAVASLTMARIQETILANGPPRLRPTAVTAEDLARRFGADIGNSCWREFAPKRLDGAAAARQERQIGENWERIRRDIEAIWVPARHLADILRRAGGPHGASDIGMSAAFYADAVIHARFLRDRYTFLDLAGDCGALADLAAT